MLELGTYRNETVWCTCGTYYSDRGINILESMFTSGYIVTRCKSIPTGATVDLRFYIMATGWQAQGGREADEQLIHVFDREAVDLTGSAIQYTSAHDDTYRTMVFTKYGAASMPGIDYTIRHPLPGQIGFRYTFSDHEIEIATQFLPTYRRGH